jgi:Leucine-rich repeat (LRR) protein
MNLDDINELIYLSPDDINKIDWPIVFEKHFGVFDKFVTYQDYVRFLQIEILKKKLRFRPNVFALNALKTLNVSNRELDVLPKEIGSLENLTELNLGNNYLNELPDEIGSLKNLVMLNLTDNHLSELPSTIKNLSKLKLLVIKDNDFTSIPVELYELKNLRILGVDDEHLNPTLLVEHRESHKSSESIQSHSNLANDFENKRKLLRDQVDHLVDDLVGKLKLASESDNNLISIGGLLV